MKKYNPGEHQLDFKFLDTLVETPRFGVSSNFATFTGWSPTVTEKWERIDFVLGGSNRRWCVHFPDYPLRKLQLVDSRVNYIGRPLHIRSVQE